MDDTRKCPYCAEEIQADAVICRFCRSRLGSLDPAHWQRAYPERRVAGVASALSHALVLPLVAVRLAFIVLVFVHFIGALLYSALWLLIPYTAGERSLLERALAEGQRLIRQLCTTGRHTAGPTSRGTPPSGSSAVSEGTLP
jgi:phage shock protein PspC (stress-responsive transcriptional regulator)